MPMTNEELEAKIGVLSLRHAQLPTKSQITLLEGLLTDYKTTTDQRIQVLIDQVTALQGVNADLLSRIQDLEAP